jgi:excisionase family DNA binding protein
VATYLSVSVPQGYALVRSGDLPAIKIGGRGGGRVYRHQLESYLERLHGTIGADPMGRRYYLSVGYKF